MKAGGTEALVNSDNGQLVSLKEEGVEFMHDGGRSDSEDSAWRASEITCFPIFGRSNNHQVVFSGQTYDVDQHGLSRALPWKVVEYFHEGVTLDQFYRGDPIPNPKTGRKGHPDTMTYMPFHLRKIFNLRQHNLTAIFSVVNNGTGPMAYNFGWHPGFQIQGEVDQGVFLDSHGQWICSLDDVLESPNEVRVEKNCNEIVYLGDQARKIKVWTPADSFTDMVLWVPENTGPVCMEPVVNPIEPGAKYFDEGEFSVLEPGKGATYRVKIVLGDR